MITVDTSSGFRIQDRGCALKKSNTQKSTIITVVDQNNLPVINAPISIYDAINSSTLITKYTTAYGTAIISWDTGLLNTGTD